MSMSTPTSAPTDAGSATGSPPDEVITHSHLRFLDVPGITGRVALITLD